MESNYITYFKETDSYIINCCLDPIDAIKFIKKCGFIDASVLNDDWLAKDYSIYQLEPGWKKTLTEHGYFIMTFVGYPYHVIEKDKLTNEQYSFIKNLFD